MVTGFSIGITQNSQNAQNNTSNVTVSLTITWNSGSYNATGNAAGTLIVDGTAYDFKAKFNTAQKSSGSEVIYSKTLTIPHGSDGSKILSCSASFATGTMAGTVTASATRTLTKIPRESTIGATDAAIGATSAIAVNRKNSAYTHSIAYQFGSISGYLADGSGAHSAKEVKLTAVSLSFPIPESFYDQIPNAPSGRCTLTVKTYSGSTQIGSAKTCTFKVTAGIESCRPEVSGTVVDINEETLALTGDENILVRGMSTACCTISAQAKNSATLTMKTIGGVAVSEDERIISGAENGSVLFAAADSRGYTNAYEKTVEMVEYVKLTCNIAAARTDPTSGNGTLTVKGNFFDGSFGAEDNSLILSYQIDGGEDIQIQAQMDGNQYTAVASLSGMDYQSAHNITVTAADKLMTVTKTVTVGKGIPVFDWGEEDFRFHTDVVMEKTLTVAGELSVGGKTLADRIYPVGAIYLSVASTNPATLFGGTWEQLKDRFLLGAGSSYTAGSTGGASTVTLTESQIPSHRHSSHSIGIATTSTGANAGEAMRSVNLSNSYGTTHYTANTGGGSAHNNMPPYLAVYMWKRTA